MLSSKYWNPISLIGFIMIKVYLFCSKIIASDFNSSMKRIVTFDQVISKLAAFGTIFDCMNDEMSLCQREKTCLSNI